MHSVRIVADSGCDLAPDLAAQYEITLVPVFVRFGQEMISSDDITPGQFWERTHLSPELPGTASPAPGTFQRRLSEAGLSGA